MKTLKLSSRKRNPQTTKKKSLKLPYIFKDPVKFDKKIDPKKLKFGSKIDTSDHQRKPTILLKMS